MPWMALLVSPLELRIFQPFFSMEVEPWSLKFSQGGNFFPCQNIVNFTVVFHGFLQGSQWRDQIHHLSCKFLVHRWSRIFEESRGNLKDSLSPKFSISQNSEIWYLILHYSMLQIWWCIQIFHLIILFFSHFSKWSVGVSIHVRATISIWLMPWDWWHEQLQQFDIRFFRWPWLWGICSVFMYFFFYSLCCINPCWCLMWDLVYYLFHDSCLMWCGIVYVIYLLSWFIMLCFEIPFLYVDGILMLSSCMFALISLLCHVGGMLIMHEFVSYWQESFLTESSCSGTSLGASPAWGNFPCMIVTSPLMYIITIDNT